MKHIQTFEAINEGTLQKFSLVKIKRGEHKGEEGRIMVYGGPKKHSVVALDYGEYNFRPSDFQLVESVNEDWNFAGELYIVTKPFTFSGYKFEKGQTVRQQHGIMFAHEKGAKKGEKADQEVTNDSFHILPKEWETFNKSTKTVKGHEYDKASKKYDPDYWAQYFESVNEADLKLDYCDKCMQMTNHKDKKCQKCKKKNESVNEGAVHKFQNEVLNLLKKLDKVKYHRVVKSIMDVGDKKYLDVIEQNFDNKVSLSQTAQELIQLADSPVITNRALLKKQAKESVNEANFNLKDLEYQIPLSVEDGLGISPKAFKSIKKASNAGPGAYRLVMSSYIDHANMKDILGHVNKALGGNLVVKLEKKGSGNKIYIIGEGFKYVKTFESVNEGANYHEYSTEDLRKMYREIARNGSAQQKKVWKQGIKRELDKRGESLNENLEKKLNQQLGNIDGIFGEEDIDKEDAESYGVKPGKYMKFYIEDVKNSTILKVKRIAKANGLKFRKDLEDMLLFSESVNEDYMKDLKKLDQGDVVIELDSGREWTIKKLRWWLGSPKMTLVDNTPGKKQIMELPGPDDRDPNFFKYFKLKESVNEDKVYIEKTGNILQLWTAYAQGSGNTTQLGKNTYITDKSGDKNFSSNVPAMVKDIRSTYKTILKAQNSTLHKIPVYPSSNGGKFTVWGGDVKPVAFHYLVVTNGPIKVITYFNNKNEARNWMKSMTKESVNEGKLTEEQQYRLKSALNDVKSKGGPPYRKAVMVILELAKRISGEDPKNIKHALRLLDSVEEVYTQVPGKMIAFDIGDDEDEEKKNDMIKKKKMKGPMGTVGYLGVAEDEDDDESEEEKTRKREGRVPGPEGGVGYAGKER
jgi:hypothetical protein